MKVKNTFPFHVTLAMVFHHQVLENLRHMHNIWIYFILTQYLLLVSLLFSITYLPSTIRNIFFHIWSFSVFYVTWSSWYEVLDYSTDLLYHRPLLFLRQGKLPRSSRDTRVFLRNAHALYYGLGVLLTPKHCDANAENITYGKNWRHESWYKNLIVDYIRNSLTN